MLFRSVSQSRYTASGKKQLDPTRGLKTRGGSRVRIYEVFYGDYINGAWYEEDRDVWIPAQWGINGEFASKQSALDLVNE